MRDALPLQQRGGLLLGVFQPGVGLRGVPLLLATGREPAEVIVKVPAQGPIQWPGPRQEYVVLEPDGGVTVQRLLDVLAVVRDRVGTWLILL